MQGFKSLGQQRSRLTAVPLIQNALDILLARIGGLHMQASFAQFDPVPARLGDFQIIKIAAVIALVVQGPPLGLPNLASPQQLGALALNPRLLLRDQLCDVSGCDPQWSTHDDAAIGFDMDRAGLAA